MNLNDFLKLNVPIFCVISQYKQAEKEIFYIKNEKLYKTTTDVLNFNNVGNLVRPLKYYITHEFKMTKIDDKRTIKAILDYGHLLGEE